MGGLREERVEVLHNGPCIAALALARAIELQVQVLVDGDRNIIDHDEQVCNCKSGEDSVCGRTHVSSRQDGNVETIRDAAEDAHEESDKAMDAIVPVEGNRDILMRHYTCIVQSSYGMLSITLVVSVVQGN